MIIFIIIWKTYKAIPKKLNANAAIQYITSTFINTFKAFSLSSSLNISFTTKNINTVDITLSNEVIGFVTYLIFELIYVKYPKTTEITTGILAIDTVVIDFVNVCLLSLFNT